MKYSRIPRQIEKDVSEFSFVRLHLNVDGGPEGFGVSDEEEGEEGLVLDRPPVNRLVNFPSTVILKLLFLKKTFFGLSKTRVYLLAFLSKITKDKVF